MNSSAPLMLCWGFSFFLYGMIVLSTHLKLLASSKLEQALKLVTTNRKLSLLLGAGITIALQSSSALTVMIVGLVHSGVMQLHQTIGIIMGSNIGTTLTAWLFSLTEIQSSSIALSVFKPNTFAPVMAFLGVIFITALKRPKLSHAGHMMVGFSTLICGLEFMSQAASPLSEQPLFSQRLLSVENPVCGILAGTVLTGIIQSSAASVGILQALALAHPISYAAAIPIIMGQNIGTCITALLSSIGVSSNAKRVAVIHILFNLIGAVLCTLFIFGGNALFPFPFLTHSITPSGIALCHTLFNVTSTLLLLPFSSQLEWLALHIIPDKARTTPKPLRRHAISYHLGSK